MIPQRRVFPTEHPRYVIQVTDDGSRTLIDPQTHVAFHSGCGAVEETWQVYLENSGLADRIRRSESSSILEMGVGLGLGLLLTIDLAQRHDAALRYVGIEREWLAASLIRNLEFEESMIHPNFVTRFCDFRDQCEPIQLGQRYRWSVSDSIEVEVLCDDFQRVADQINETFDAIYFDPFDPVTNPEIWTEAVFRKVKTWLKPEGRLVTYCVNRVVRDALTAAGWKCERVSGPRGGKREVLIATVEV
jgi:tRNA U34 5-methylaminomethyl-2-thiouridine-forming methyltransferase MnmC